MAQNTRALVSWTVVLAVVGVFVFYVWSEKPTPSAAPKPVETMWSLTAYDSGKFYFSENLTTQFRTVCESADCTPLLTEVGFLSSHLTDVKREGLHLIVKQNGVEYHFRIEAMGDLDDTKTGSGEGNGRSAE